MEIYGETYHRRGIRTRVDWVRRELDSWADEEYPNMSRKTTYRLYMGALYRVDPKRSINEEDRAEMLDKLNRIGDVLREHYSGAGLLEEIQHKLIVATGSLNRWTR